VHRSRGSFRRGLKAGLLILTGLGGLFALALLVGAVTGSGFGGGVVLGAAGLVLLLLVILVFVFVVMYGKSSRSS
jgi:hypothetical protein